MTSCAKRAAAIQLDGFVASLLAMTLQIPTDVRSAILRPALAWIAPCPLV
jgi:hypothetical protein